MMNTIRNEIITYLQMYQQNPLKLLTLIVDLSIVLFLAYNLLKIAKDSRAWQLIKGIAFLVIATWLSRVITTKYFKLYTFGSNELGSYSFNYNFST